MKKVLFWDFGDVLVFYDHMRSCTALAKFSPLSADEIYAAIFGSGREEQHYNRGEYSDYEWYVEVAKLINLDGCSYDAFSEIWGDIFTPNPLIGAVLDAVDPSVAQYVLSNTNGLHFTWARKNIPILSSHFSRTERAILSSEEKSRKPEEMIFWRALARAGVPAEAAFFVDDKAVNVDAFKLHGGNGFVYSARDASTDELMGALRGFGLLRKGA